MFALGQLRRLMFGISLRETTFSRRGFPETHDSTQEHLERIGRMFVLGYHAALEESDLSRLTAKLEEVETEYRGFAYEGAAMGLALLDQLTPWNRSRVQKFLAASAAEHVYMVYVGIGWAAARLGWVRRNIETFVTNFDPLLGRLIIDGFGFHQGYFSWQRYIRDQQLPRLSAEAQQVFDQGLGRSLWFVKGAQTEKIVAAIDNFPLRRRADLWSGIGLACTYAGGADRAAVERIWNLAGPFQPYLAQGSAFAAKARERAGLTTENTKMVCDVFCAISPVDAAYITDRSLNEQSETNDELTYLGWRQRIVTHFSEVLPIKKNLH